VQKKTSIYDIANALGITASTVSRALRGHTNISQEITQQVKDMAKKMNYRKNTVAVNLKNGYTKTIAVIIPQLNRQFFASAIDGIEEIASKSGYNVIICQTRNDVTKEKKAVQLLSESVVDGFIVSVVTDKSDYAHFRNVLDQQIPVVFFDRYPLASDFKRICLDDFEASMHAVEQLASLNKRKIFHFSGHQHVSIWRERTRGYLEGMKNLGIEVPKEWISENTLTHEAGVRAAEKMIRDNNIPDAIFSSSDHPLIGALFVLRKNGYRIPEDIAMTGYGNEMFTSYTQPSLSTVDQRSAEMGREAFVQLMRMIRGESIPDEIVLRHKLIVRESSMPAAAAGGAGVKKKPK